MAQYGSPSSMYMPPSSTSSGSSGSSGSGTTHTVIVAPTQGVLRYVPFAVNASVGDTVKFMWGANEHTVTKSSELALCNKTSDQPFASGEQNQSFVCKNKIHLLLIKQLTRCSQSLRLSTTLTPPSTTAVPPLTARRACSVSSIRLLSTTMPTLHR